jgi:hypothetical protein
MKEKLSNICIYQTPKIVKVIDRKVGLIYYTICTAILSYIIFYVLMYKKQYYVAEKTSGGSAVIPKGTFIGYTPAGETRVFDVWDIVKSTEETSALFIAT